MNVRTKHVIPEYVARVWEEGAHYNEETGTLSIREKRKSGEGFEVVNTYNAKPIVKDLMGRGLEYLEAVQLLETSAILGSANVGGFFMTYKQGKFNLKFARA